MSYDSLLNDTCTVQTRTSTFSATGASTTAYANKLTDEPCTIQPRTGRRASYEQGEETNITHVGFYQIGSDIVNTDKVIDSGGSEYIVRHVFDAAARVHHKEVELEILVTS